jgi:hypothetical protein
LVSKADLGLANKISTISAVAGQTDFLSENTITSISDIVSVKVNEIATTEYTLSGSTIVISNPVLVDGDIVTIELYNKDAIDFSSLTDDGKINAEITAIDGQTDFDIAEHNVTDVNEIVKVTVNDIETVDYSVDLTNNEIIINTPVISAGDKVKIEIKKIVDVITNNIFLGGAEDQDGTWKFSVNVDGALEISQRINGMYTVISRHSNDTL